MFEGKYKSKNIEGKMEGKKSEAKYKVITRSILLFNMLTLINFSFFFLHFLFIKSNKFEKVENFR